jgi:carnitine O-acetyltransferase
VESAELCSAWIDPLTTAEQKVALLRRACEKHTDRMNLCKNARGVDRHWYGLLNLARHKQQRLPKYQLPMMFRDPRYSRLMTSVISTSNVTAPCFRLFGFGAVVGNGLGVAYNIHDMNLYINITSVSARATKGDDIIEVLIILSSLQTTTVHW